MAEKTTRVGRRATTKAVPRDKTPAKRARRDAANQAASSKAASVIMQARVDEGFARTLVEQDAVVLGLDGPSALVREGLRLVHERAREAAMIDAYDKFYAGKRAPLPSGVAPADRD